MPKYVLRRKREDGGYLYLVSIAAFGFPVTTPNIEEATELNCPETVKGMIVGEFETLEV